MGLAAAEMGLAAAEMGLESGLAAADRSQRAR
jgi:hypothetical protein